MFDPTPLLLGAVVDPTALLLGALVLPWTVMAATLVAGGDSRVREAVAVAGGIGLLGAVLGLVPAVLDGDVAVLASAEFVSDVRLAFEADAAGVFFALVVSTLWPLASSYTVGYLDASDAHARPRLLAAFAASIGSVVGLAFAENLLTLFVFYELLTVATYPLVVHKESADARAAGRKYAAYALSGGVAVFAGTVLVYAMTGSVAFAPGGIQGIATADPTLARAAFALLVAGFGVKAALMPLHGWLPSAMVAPTPVSGLLHAVAVVKSGVFGIGRVVLYVYGPETVQSLGVGVALATAAATTMVLAGVLALRQEKLKRGLAYSTISQLSYIVLGLAVLTPTAIQGAFLHLSAHALMKFVLFFCAGIIYVETHVERIDELAGIGRRLPVTMTAFAVAAAGLVGLPLVAGFVSKWYLLTGLFVGGNTAFAALLLLAGLLKLLFFWPILSTAFAATPDDVRDAERSQVHADGGADHVGHGERKSNAPGHDGFERPSRGLESRWRLLGPVLVALAVAIAFGIVPTELPFFDLATLVSEVTST